MSSSARIIHSTLILLLLLAGCGFHPVYGTSAEQAKKSIVASGIKVSVSTSGSTSTLPTSSDSSFDNSSSAAMSRQFTNNLEDMVSSESSPTYKLDVTLTYSNVGVGVARDGTALRYNLVLNSTYNLTRIADGKLVDRGTLSNVTSYNNPSNQYFSTYISEQDARKRGITELAELYRHRLLAFSEKATPKPDKAELKK